MAAKAEIQRQLLREEMSGILTDGHRISFTLNLCTDQYIQISYLTITAHWINTEWELVSNVLCMQEFDTTKKKTGDNINAAISSALEDLGIDIASEQITFTTDRGSNMIPALRSEETLDCVVHILNTAVV